MWRQDIVIIHHCLLFYLSLSILDVPSGRVGDASLIRIIRHCLFVYLSLSILDVPSGRVDDASLIRIRMLLNMQNTVQSGQLPYLQLWLWAMTSLYICLWCAFICGFGTTSKSIEKPVEMPMCVLLQWKCRCVCWLACRQVYWRKS